MELPFIETSSTTSYTQMSDLAVVQSTCCSFKQSQEMGESPNPFTPCPNQAKLNFPVETSRDGEEMAVDAPGSPLDHTLRVNVVAIGSSPEDFVFKQIILQCALLLNTLTTFEGEVDPMDTIVVLRVLASAEDGLDLDQAIFKHFKGGVSLMGSISKVRLK